MLLRAANAPYARRAPLSYALGGCSGADWFSTASLQEAQMANPTTRMNNRQAPKPG